MFDIQYFRSGISLNHSRTVNLGCPDQQSKWREKLDRASSCKEKVDPSRLKNQNGSRLSQVSPKLYKATKEKKI